MTQPTVSEPSVCALLLTADRPHLARRAVESFRRQTYPAKRLFGLDSSANSTPGLPWGDSDSTVMWVPALDLPIGGLRNYALHAALGWHEFEIVVHFDDDDWSHPNRIAEQVELLQSSGADVVGFREMLFWREGQLLAGDPSKWHGEAWLYSNPNPGYALGTSLCYWRRTWERKPFPATSFGEDIQFCTGLKVCGVSYRTVEWHGNWHVEQEYEPRMIARIHAGNTSTAYTPAKMAAAREWRRVPEWDKYCRRTLEA